MVEIGYSDSRDPFGLGGKGPPCDNWKLKRVSKYIISCSKFPFKKQSLLKGYRKTYCDVWWVGLVSVPKRETERKMR